MKTVGIVIPCFNEEQNIPPLIERLSNKVNPQVQFLIVDNGSQDKTQTILSSLLMPQNVTTIRLEKNQGYGGGIVSGLNHLKTDYVGWTHADLQTDPEDVYKFLDDINLGREFLKGKRYGRPIVDRFFTFGMSCLFTALFRCVIQDINGQPTIMKRELFEKWDSPPSDFALDSFAYIKSKRMGCQIVRKDVFFGERQYGRSHWNNGFKSRLKFIKRTIEAGIELRGKA